MPKVPVSDDPYDQLTSAAALFERFGFDLPYEKMKQSDKVEDFQAPSAAAYRAQAARSVGNFLLSRVDTAFDMADRPFKTYGEYDKDIEKSVKRDRMIPIYESIDRILKADDAYHANKNLDLSAPPSNISALDRAEANMWRRIGEVLKDKR